MKKAWLLIAVIAIVSCKNETPIDYAIISGKITNATTSEATIYGVIDRDFRKKLTLEENGSFKDTLKAGSYLFSQGRNKTPLYVSAGDNITINFDAKDFKNSLTLSGKGSQASVYLIAKGGTEKELMGSGTGVYVKEEAEYKSIFLAIKVAQEKLLSEASGISDDFVAKEKRNIKYAYLEKLNRYQLYHSHYAKKKNFEPSKQFLSELETLKYDNEEDFNFSTSYKSLVTNHYQKKAGELAKTASIDRGLAMLKVGQTITHKTIKNNLLYEAAKYGITYTNNLEAFYNAFMAGSTDKNNNEKITKSYKALKVVAKGNVSPKFVDYENNAGGTTSLDDLKGKYVYVDVWATWCGPCKAEIPFLKNVEKKYHRKNIHFLSLSIDKAKDHDKWKAMIKDKELGGIQLFADNDWNSKFVTDYLIKGIPRFILIDPAGNIVTANAPRPSDKKLIELFDELKI
ncbi:MAG: TlpA disulfide reductase family protein [Polaribacter sp.]|nr:TlpA disulfide reductase family protein [Polaribacter sp.]